MTTRPIDMRIPTIGKPKIESPIANDPLTDGPQLFVPPKQKVVIEVDPEKLTASFHAKQPLTAFELAGPRQKIYFDPSKLRCALVTCGGLCPGLNDIIRAIVLELYHRYGVRHISGVRFGLQGFIASYGHQLMDLTPQTVSNILDRGGSILGSSRGPQPIEEIVDSLDRMSIGILFMIGGDGTLMAAKKICDEITRRQLKIAVVGIPKTIDNDIHLVSRSFGFDTAVDVATQAIKGAHNESESYPRGIGLIKLMGRYSGFIAATAALSQQEVNFVLIPEVDFDLEGDQGLLAKLQTRLAQRGHAVIVVAEGAGQKFFRQTDKEHDASGNIRLKDIGVYLKDRITEFFTAQNLEISLKYIDPSYMIRSLPANANDRVFCSFLGRDAVHAGMAGKTELLLGHWNNHFVHIPMGASAGQRKQVQARGKLWQSVLSATGQGSLVNV